MAEVQEASPGEVSGAEESVSDSEIEIIRSKQFSLKPMDSEEAVLQMNLLGHDFFILQIERQMGQALFTDVKTVNTD